MALDLPFLKKGVKSTPAPAAKQSPRNEQLQTPLPRAPPPPTELDDIKIKVELYRLILSRYEKYIEEAESKSISDLKAMIKPHDRSATEVKISILDSFHPYDPKAHFIAAADSAIAHVAKIRSIELPLNFWLEFDQMESVGAADEMDKAIYLCSILRSLDCQDARVLITASKKPYVLFEFNSQHHLVNTTSATRIYGTKEQVLATLGTDKPQYSFSDTLYEEYGEEG